MKKQYRTPLTHTTQLGINVYMEDGTSPITGISGDSGLKRGNDDDAPTSSDIKGRSWGDLW